jgi:hypothetical protein
MDDEKYSEKDLAKTVTKSPDDATIHDASIEEIAISNPTNRLERWANKLDVLAGVEARGIERIPEELRERKMALGDYVHMFTMYVASVLSLIEVGLLTEL